MNDRQEEPVPPARLRLPPRWYLGDARFLKASAWTCTLFGACLFSTVIMELAYGDGIVRESFRWSSQIIGAGSFLLAVVAATVAGCRALKPKLAPIEYLWTDRGRLVALLVYAPCFAAFFLLLIFAAKLGLGWRIGGGLLCMTAGAYLTLRARRWI